MPLLVAIHLKAKAQPSGCAFIVSGCWMRPHRQPGFGGAALFPLPFLNPRSPAMNASSMCGISVTASTASPYACACSAA